MAGGVKGTVKPPSSGGDGGFGKDIKIGEDFGTYDQDPESWLRGYVGGEVPGSKHRFGEQHDWDGDEGTFECCTEGDAPGFSASDRRRGYKTVK